MNYILSNINKIVNEKKLKHTALANMLGWSESKLSKVLSDQMVLKDEMINEIAKVLGVEVAIIIKSQDDIVQNDSNNKLVNGITINEVSLLVKLLEEKDKLLAEKDKYIAHLEKMIKKD
jgi:plasmid maintenance system antidote protein VapI